MNTISETNLRVLIADENEEALHSLHDVLARLGHEVTPYAVSVHEAPPIPADDARPRVSCFDVPSAFTLQTFDSRFTWTALMAGFVAPTGSA